MKPSPDTNACALVVSDLPSLRADISHWLFSPRLRVVPAETADKVFRRSLETTFDLVVWDATTRTEGMAGAGLAVTDEFGDTPAIILYPPETPPMPTTEVRESVQMLPRDQLTRENFLAAVHRASPAVGALVGLA